MLRLSVRLQSALKLTLVNIVEMAVAILNLRVDPTMLVGVFLMAAAAGILAEAALTASRGLADEHSKGDPGPDSLLDTARSGSAGGVVVAVVQGAVMGDRLLLWLTFLRSRKVQQPCSSQWSSRSLFALSQSTRASSASFRSL